MRYKVLPTVLGLLTLALLCASCQPPAWPLLELLMLSSEARSGRLPRAELHVLKDLPRPLVGTLSVIVEPQPGVSVEAEDLARFTRMIVGRLEHRGMQIGTPSSWAIQIHVLRYEPGSYWRRVKRDLPPPLYAGGVHTDEHSGYLDCTWKVTDQFGAEVGTGRIEGSVKSGMMFSTMYSVLSIAADKFVHYLMGDPTDEADAELE